MSKNYRKVLATASAAALLTAGLTAAPAYAADDLSLAPSVGTAYGVNGADTFVLHSAVAGNTNIANAGFMKYLITNPSEVTLNVSGQYWNAGGAPAAYADAVIAPAASADASKVFAATNSTATLGKVNKLTINPTTTSTTGTFSITVQAFSDLDGSGTLNAGDLSSPARTITWYADSTAAVILDDVYAGAASTATLTFDQAINYEMITLPTSTFAVNGASAAGAASALNTAKTGVVLTQNANGAASQIISATGKWLRYDGDADLASATSAAKQVAAASTATTGKISSGADASYNQKDAVAADFNGGALIAAGADANENLVLRATDAKSVTFVINASNADGIVAGAPATVTVAETANSTLAAGTVITAGGKTLKDAAAGAADSISYNTSTDAAGNVTVTIATDDATADDEVLVTVVSGTATAEIGLVWKAAAIAAGSLALTNDTVGSAVRYVTKGSSSTTLNYLLTDQFGKPWTRTNYNYRLTFTAAGAANAATPGTVVLSGGAASVTFTDQSTATGNYTLTAALQEQTGAGAWGAAAGLAAGAINVDEAFTVVTASDSAAALAIATVLDGGGAIAAAGVPLALKDLRNLDNRGGTQLEAGLGVAANKGAKVTVTATKANGAVAAGVPVTISAPGVAFATAATGTGLVNVGSISGTSAADGTFVVYAYSNTSGTVTLTASSGAASKTADLKVAAAGDGSTSNATSVAWTVTNASAGKTMTVQGVVTDKYGNVIDNAAGDIKITYDGPGFVVGTLPTETDANGAFKFNVLLGVNDTISGDVSVDVDADSDADLAADAEAGDVDFVSTQSLAPAAPAADTKVNAGSFKGYVAIYAKGHAGKRLSAKVGNDWVVVPALASNFVRVVEYTGAGYTIAVRIYIDRVLVDTITVTTK